MNADAAALVVPLEGLDRADIAIAGGKAANLGALIRAGFPVPAGFCVTTAAYARAAEGSAIGRALEELAGVGAEELARLEALAGQARGALLEAPVPAEVADAVAAAYRALGGGAVAVRSSATAEDLPDASFAGQQDTYLGVTGEGALIEAVRRCWASLWTDRAVAYRARNRIDPRAVQLAVVVQRMVPAAVAGVLFTANPVTGARGRAVIDASPGLGEAVVSGAVNPDRFEVDAASGAILERRLGDKRVAIEAAPEGGTRRVVREDASGEACVSDDEVRALARLGAQVEAHYGAPQDLEWALDAERRILLLQARPITTLFPLPEGAPAPGAGLRVYLSFNVAQGVLRPLTPLGADALRRVAGALATAVGLPPADPAAPPFFVEAAGYLLIDLTGPLRSKIGRRLVRFAFERMEARSAAAIETLLQDPRLSPEPASPWRLARGVLGALSRTRAPLTLAKAWLRPEGAPARCERAGAEALAAGEVREVREVREVPARAGGEARVDAVERLLGEGVPRILAACAPTFGAGMLALLAARKLLGGDATRAEIDAVMRALPHNPTTEMDLALWKLAASVREDAAIRRLLLETPPAELSARYRRGALPARLQGGLAAFLGRYGARGVAEIDAGVTRWGEDPAHLLGSLSNYLSLDAGAIAPDAAFERAAREAEATAEALAARASARGRLRGAAVALALRRTRQLAGLREAPKLHLVRTLDRARKLLLEAGAELAAAGRLDAAGDVFMLRLAEVRAGLRGEDQRALARARRAAYGRELGRRWLPRILLSDGTDVEAAAAARAPAAGPGIAGTPASAGTVTGRARVVLDPIGARLLPGEILVAPSTDPGWTPLFLTAGGLVMEMGGAMSHGAVVAREVGIPAVVGVPRATERIATGQVITVDGARGTVAVAAAG